MKRAFTILVAFALVLLSPATFAPSAEFIDAAADGSVKTSGNLFVRGYVRQENLSGIPNVNVTATLSVSTGTSITSSSGFFEVNLTAPSVAGDYAISLSTNTSLSRSLPTTVRNISAANISFLSSKPPFTNGSSFLVNVSFDGTPVSAPVLQIYTPNGNASGGWTITNLTAIDATMTYNITSPAAAEGKYVLIVEKGAGFVYFLIRSSLTIAADIQDTDNSTKTVFAPGGTAIIVSKIRNSDGPVSTATVTAFITLPNATVRSVSLSHSSTNGTYTGTFTDTTTHGTYGVRIAGNVSGRILDASAFFSVQSIEAKLDIVRDFFFEFGSSSAFRAGGQVAFNVLVYNKSDDDVLSGSMAGAAGTVNCSAIMPLQLKNAVTGTAIPFNITNITNSIGTYFDQQICRINFTAPAASGIYVLKVGAVSGNSTNNLSTTATGYFAVQSYVLKASPVSSIGGGNEYMSSVVPGDNVTFEISARNLSSNGSAVPGNLVTSVTAIRILPLNFVGGGTQEITNITYLVTAGSAGSSPKVAVILPDNATGPFSIEFQASVDGNTIRGNAFYFAKYVDGFLYPSGYFNNNDSSSSFRCNGTRTFVVKLFDVRTKQPAKSVSINSVYDAREERTGRSVKTYLNVSSSTVSDSNGQANISLSFTPATYSGFYLLLINVTTPDGKNDVITGGFECKSLNFFPLVYSSSQQYFRIGSTDNLTVSIDPIFNIANGPPQQVMNGSVRILKLENFDRANGMKVYSGPATTIPLDDGGATFNLSPANFSLQRWPSDFSNLVIRVCDNSTNTCDEGFAGFMSITFEAFIDYSLTGGLVQAVPFDNITMAIKARTNVLNESVQSTLNGFQVDIGQPWAGATVHAGANGTKISDSWNATGDPGFELWNVTFQVPSGARKGGNVVTITIKNYLNETTAVDLFLNVVKNNIYVPNGEGVQMSGAFVAYNDGNLSAYGFNATNLSEMSKYGNLSSKSGVVCIRSNLTAQRFDPSQTVVNYASSAFNVTIMVLDNGTAGVYDTVVINKTSMANFTVVRAGQSLATAISPAFAGLYLRRIHDCGFIEIINSTAPTSGFGSGFAGQQRKAVNFYVPVIVKQGNNPRPGALIDVSQVVLQQDFGGGMGGFGFNGFLSASNYSKTSAVTDANGVGFLLLNVTASGTFGLIWNATIGTETDVAEFSQVVPFEVKTFNTRGGFAANAHLRRAVNLTRNVTETRNITVSGSPIYVGSWNESAQGELIGDLFTGLHYIALRNVTENPRGTPMAAIPEFSDLVIDNDANMNVTCLPGACESDGFEPVYGNWTERFGAMQFTPRYILASIDFAIDGNRTIDENNTNILFAYADMGNSKFTTINSPSQSLAFRVCAMSFDKPEKPIIGANITLQAETFTGGGPPSLSTLAITDPFTGGTSETILTGPSGCASFNATRTGGWAMTNNIKGYVLYNGANETIFLGSLNVYGG